MSDTYNVIIQFKDKPLLVFSNFTLTEALAMVGIHNKDFISCQIEKVK